MLVPELCRNLEEELAAVQVHVNLDPPTQEDGDPMIDEVLIKGTNILVQPMGQDSIAAASELENLQIGNDAESEQEAPLLANNALALSFTIPASCPVLSPQEGNLMLLATTQEEENSPRRSGRIATKLKQCGKKKHEEMAQEVLAKKLGILQEIPDKVSHIRNRIMKLFQEPIFDRVM